MVNASNRLYPANRREGILARALEPARRQYDVILIDCAPSLELLTVNAATAAMQVATRRTGCAGADTIAVMRQSLSQVMSFAHAPRSAGASTPVSRCLGAN